MIKINTLLSLEPVKDIYYITEDLDIININTSYVKKHSQDHNGYYYVTLESNEGRSRKVFVHKIVALAGTIKELIQSSGIPKGTLYEYVYRGISKRNKYNIKKITELTIKGVQTIENLI